MTTMQPDFVVREVARRRFQVKVQPGTDQPVLSAVRAAYAEATGQDATYRFRHFVMLAIGHGVRGREALVAHAQRQGRVGREPRGVDMWPGR